MTITPHLLAGAALAQTTSSYPIAFLMGFLSHFVLDAIPHIDPGTFHRVDLPIAGKIDLEKAHDNRPWPKWIYAFVVVEFVIIWAVAFLLFRNRPDFGLIVTGGLGGIFVDGMDNPVFQFMLKWPVLKQIHWLHHFVHHDIAIDKWYWGVLFEIIIIGGSLWLLIK